MKQHILLATIIIFCTVSSRVAANNSLNTDSVTQDTAIVTGTPSTKQDEASQPPKSHVEREDRTFVRIGNRVLFESYKTGDSLNIRLGKEQVPNTQDDIKTNQSDQNKKPKFNGHWDNIQLGRVLLANSDYKIYDNPYDEFMELNESKSVEFNLNWEVTDFALNKRKTIGGVAGVGLSWNNLQFSNDITLAKSGGKITPVSLANGKSVKKSKLTALYLDIPLLIEFQSKHSKSSKPVYFSIGAIGSLKLGSHTKIKYSGDKDKERGNFYLTPFRYGSVVVIGYRGIHLYGKYFVNDLFQSGKGPNMNQYAIGIGIFNWY